MRRENSMVVHKRMSFFASLVWGISLIIITAIVSVSGIAVYCLNVADRQMDGLSGFVERLVAEVPDLIKALPPILGDALADRRAPGYLDKLDIKVTVGDHPYYEGRMEPVVSIHNSGSETVSWLTLRVVVRDSDNRILSERTEYAVTPLALDNDCPGPLMPGSTRRLTAGSYRAHGANDVLAEYEVTDIRVWVEDQDKPSDAQTQSSVLEGTLSQVAAN